MHDTDKELGQKVIDFLLLAKQAGKVATIYGELTTREVGKLIRTIIGKQTSIELKAWRFQDRSGNTYHTVKVWYNDQLVYHSPKTYGYGSQYEYTAQEWLVQKGLITCDQYTPLWEACEQSGIKYIENVWDCKNLKEFKENLPN